MNLFSQVVSLDLAKCLKELGVKQEGASYWWYPRNNKLIWQGNTSRTWESMIAVGYIAAFTVAELGEMLPQTLWEPYDIEHYVYSNPRKYGIQAMTYHAGIAKNHHSVMADTEADARAKMLVYLIENKLIEV